LRFRVSLMDEHGSAADPKKLAEPLTALAARYPALADQRAALERADHALAEARASALALDWPAATHHLAAAANAIQATPGLAGTVESAAKQPAAKARPQEDSELQRVLARINRALQLAAALHIDAQASRREAIPGESFTVSVAERQREHAFDSVGEPRLI